MIIFFWLALTIMTLIGFLETFVRLIVSLVVLKIYFFLFTKNQAEPINVIIVSKNAYKKFVKMLNRNITVHNIIDFNKKISKTLN